MGFLGYLECDNCSKFIYVKDPSDIKIWYHPDDQKPLAEASCTKCSNKVTCRIDFDHMANFKRRGCSVYRWNDRFTKLTKAMIDEWDFDAEWALCLS